MYRYERVALFVVFWWHSVSYVSICCLLLVSKFVLNLLQSVFIIFQFYSLKTNVGGNVLCKGWSTNIPYAGDSICHFYSMLPFMWPKITTTYFTCNLFSNMYSVLMFLSVDDLQCSSTLSRYCVEIIISCHDSHSYLSHRSAPELLYQGCNYHRGSAPGPLSTEGPQTWRDFLQNQTRFLIKFILFQTFKIN